MRALQRLPKKKAAVPCQEPERENDVTDISDFPGYETDEEREKMILKVCDMIDDYEDEHGDDGMDGFSLFNDLNAELERNGFLSRISQAAQETASEMDATKLPEDHKKKAKVGQKQ